jgi:hypothetical protein
MIRLHTLFWLIVVAATGFAMFAVKYQVQGLADQLARTVNQADDVERGIRVLDAEWAYLNRPDALAQKNQRFLSLAPIATKQLRSDVADIPMRPPPVPSAATGVAFNAPAPAAAATPAKDEPPQAGAPASASALARPAEEAGPVVTAALDQAHLSRSAKPSTTSKPAVRPVSLRRAASLTELIAQITESRQ